jgi:hypothetical protein
VRDFLISTAMTVAVIGIPTVLHWIWSGRAAPLSASYDLVLAHLLKWFGTMCAVVAAILFMIAFVDVLFNGFGYPLWSLPFSATMIAIGLLVRRGALAWLAHQRREEA